MQAGVGLSDAKDLRGSWCCLARSGPGHEGGGGGRVRSGEGEWEMKAVKGEVKKGMTDVQKGLVIQLDRC